MTPVEATGRTSTPRSPSNASGGTNTAAVNAAQTQLQGANQRFATAESGLRLIESSAAGLGTDISRARSTATAAQSAYTQLQNRFQSQQNALTQSSTKVTTAQSALTTADQALATAKNEAKTAEAAQRSARSELTEATAALDNAKRIASNSSENVADAQKSVDKAQDRFDDAKAKVEKAQDKLTDAQSDVRKAESDVTKAQSRVDSLQSKVDSAQAKFDSAQVKVDSAQQKFDTATKAVATAQSAFDTAKNAANAADGRVNQARSALSSATNARQAAQGRVNAAQGKVNSARSEVNAAKAELSAAQNAKPADPNRVARARQRLNSANARLNSATNELNAANAALDRAKDAEARAREALKRAEQEAERAKQRLREAEAALKAAKEAQAAAKRALDAAKDELDAAKKALANAKKELDQAKEALEKAQKALDKANRVLADAQKSVGDAEKKLSDAQSKLDKAKADLTSAKEKQTKAKADLETAKDKKTQAQEAFDKAKREAAKADDKIDNATKKQKQAKDAYDQAKKAHDKLEGEVKKLQSELTEKKNAADKKQQEVTRLEKEKAAKDTQIAEAKARVKAAKDEVNAAQAALTKARTAAANTNKQDDAANIAGDTNKDGRLSTSERNALARSGNVNDLPQAERDRLLAEQQQLVEAEKAARERYTAVAGASGGAQSEESALEKRVDRQVNKEIIDERRRYYAANPYYVDPNTGAVSIARVDRSGNLVLSNTQNVPASGGQPETNTRSTTKIKTDRSRTDTSVTTNVPRNNSEPRQTYTETVNTNAAGRQTSAERKLEQVVRNADGTTSTSLSQSRYNKDNVETSRVQEQTRPQANGDVTTNRVETTFREDGQTPSRVVNTDSVKKNSSKETSTRVVDTQLRADGKSPQRQTVTESGTDAAGKAITTTKAETDYLDSGDPATTYITRTGGELARGQRRSEFIEWGADGVPKSRTTGRQNATREDYEAFLKNGGADSSRTEELSLRSVDPAKIPGSEDPMRWTRTEKNRFEGDSLNGNLVEPLKPSNAVPSVFDIPSQLRAHASAAAIDDHFKNNPEKVADLQAEQLSYQAELNAASDPVVRERIMREYFSDHDYWVEPGVNGEPPVVMAAAWSNGVPSSEMFGAERARSAHAVTARTGIQGTDDQDQPATIDVVQRLYVDGSQDDIVRTSYSGTAGASRVVVTGEHTSKKGVVTESDRHAQTMVSRVEQGLEPLAITEISRERFADELTANGAPKAVGEQFYAVATSDSTMTTLEEKRDFYSPEGIIYDTRINSTQMSRNFDEDITEDFLAVNAAQIQRALDNDLDINDDGTSITTPPVGSYLTKSETDIDYDANGVAIFQEVTDKTVTVSDAEDDNHNGVRVTSTDTTRTVGSRTGSAPIFDADGKRIANENIVTRINTNEFDPDAGSAGGDKGDGFQFRETTSISMGSTNRPDGTRTGEWATPLTITTLMEGHDDDWVMTEKFLKTNSQGQLVDDDGRILDGSDEKAKPVELGQGDQVRDANGKLTTLASDGRKREDLDFADKFEEFMEGWGGKIIGVAGVVAGVALMATGVGSPLGVALAAGGVALATTQFAYTAMNFRQDEASGWDLALAGAGVAFSALPAITGVRQLANAGRLSSAARSGSSAIGAADDVARAGQTVATQGRTLGQQAMRVANTAETGLDGLDAYDAGRAALHGDFWGAGMMLFAIGGGHTIGRIRGGANLPSAPDAAPARVPNIPDSTTPSTGTGPLSVDLPTPDLPSARSYSASGTSTGPDISTNRAEPAVPESSVAGARSDDPSRAAAPSSANPVMPNSWLLDGIFPETRVIETRDGVRMLTASERTQPVPEITFGKNEPKKFKDHAGDLAPDLAGRNWNGQVRDAFRVEVNNIVSSAADGNGYIVDGTYRDQPAIIAHDTKSNRMVVLHPNGEFWSGWSPNSGQVDGVTQFGTLGKSTPALDFAGMLAARRGTENISSSPSPAAAPDMPSVGSGASHPQVVGRIDGDFIVEDAQGFRSRQSTSSVLAANGLAIIPSDIDLRVRRTSGAIEDGYRVTDLQSHEGSVRLTGPEVDRHTSTLETLAQNADRIFDGKVVRIPDGHAGVITRYLGQDASGPLFEVELHTSQGTKVHVRGEVLVSMNAQKIIDGSTLGQAAAAASPAGAVAAPRPDLLDLPNARKVPATSMPGGHFRLSAGGPIVDGSYSFRGGYEFDVDGVSVLIESPSSIPDQDVADRLDLVRQMISQTPRDLTQKLNRVQILEGRNPFDLYWEKEYDMPNFHSAATGGNGTVNYWTGTGRDPLGTFHHEVGHVFGQDGGPLNAALWRRAAELDRAHRGGRQAEANAELSSNDPSGTLSLNGELGVTSYGQSAIDSAGVFTEDFAESIRLQLLSDRQGYIAYRKRSGIRGMIGSKRFETYTFADLFPHRADAIAGFRMLQSQGIDGAFYNPAWAQGAPLSGIASTQAGVTNLPNRFSTIVGVDPVSGFTFGAVPDLTIDAPTFLSGRASASIAARMSHEETEEERRERISRQ